MPAARSRVHQPQVFMAMHRIASTRILRCTWILGCRWDRTSARSVMDCVLMAPPVIHADGEHWHSRTESLSRYSRTASHSCFVKTRNSGRVCRPDQAQRSSGWCQACAGTALRLVRATPKSSIDTALHSGTFAGQRKWLSRACCSIPQDKVRYHLRTKRHL